MQPKPSSVAPSGTTPITATPLRLAHVTPDPPVATGWPILLDTGNVLRIRDGGGMRVTTASGVLWITEENSTSDTVLLPGETHRVSHPGLTLVAAHWRSLALLEADPDVAPPRRVDVAVNEGAPGHRIAWHTAPGRLHFRSLLTALRMLMRNALSWIPGTAQELRESSAEAGRDHDPVNWPWVIRDARRAAEGEEALAGRARHEISRDLPVFPYY